MILKRKGKLNLLSHTWATDLHHSNTMHPILANVKSLADFINFAVSNFDCKFVCVSLCIWLSNNNIIADSMAKMVGTKDLKTGSFHNFGNEINWQVYATETCNRDVFHCSH